MPALSYSYPDFTPNTIIRSAQVNAKYNDIKTLLNTTGLDDSNLQNAGITRATKLKTGPANYVLINNGSGAMSEEATLATSRGGLGVALSPTGADVGKTLQINSSGTIVLGNPVNTPSGNIYSFFRAF